MSQGTARPSALFVWRFRSRDLSQANWRRLTATYDASEPAGPVGSEDAIALRTCERLEFYTDQEAFTPTTQPGLLIGRGALRLHGSEAFRHLIRVASGLDSRLLGETQILGQLRRSIERAQGLPEHQRPSRSLLATMRRGLRAGRFVRRRCSFEALATSYVQLAYETLEPSIRQVAVLGSGRLARDLLDRIATPADGRTLQLFARDPDLARERCRNTIRQHGVAVSPLEALPDALGRFDAILAATASPRLLLRRSQLETRSQPLLAIDLGSPANIDPDLGDHPSVTRYDLGDLAARAPRQLATIRHQADKAVQIELDREFPEGRGPWTRPQRASHWAAVVP